MSFRLPNFNLTVNIWRFAHPFDPLAPPDVISPANFCLGKRVYTAQVWPDEDTAANYMNRYLLLPKGTDIRGLPYYIGGDDHDFVEVPAGSGRYYGVMDSEVVARGFLNEHVFALVEVDPSDIATLPPIT